MWRGVPWREGVCVYGVVGDGGSCCLHHKIKIRIFQFVKATTGGISTIRVTLATFVFKQVTVKVLPCKKTTKHTKEKKDFSPSILTLTNYINSGTDCKVSLA